MDVSRRAALSRAPFGDTLDRYLRTLSICDFEKVTKLRVLCSKPEKRRATEATGEFIVNRVVFTNLMRHRLITPQYVTRASYLVSWTGSNGFVLTGIEFIGDVAYAQSWWCRFIA
ncbi:hypothetical protein BH160DRAFT_1343 [Burkholderia sp. H160]|nr:hypothetical protein BH160DRAFT_1343 [Burkholderia sp. H160]